MRLYYQQNYLYFGNNSESLQKWVDSHTDAFYLYDLVSIETRVKEYLQSFSVPVRAHFAMKANAHPEVLRCFLRLGLGVDVVSAGEIGRALQVGFRGSDIVFSGVAKSHAEIKLAIENNVRQINIESLAELLRVAAVARDLRREQVPVALRINPAVDAITHPSLKTGALDSKFGILETELPQALQILREQKNLRTMGVSLHIGSQIMDLQPLGEALNKALRWTHQLRTAGFKPETVDVGGGLGVDYHANADSQETEHIAKYGELVSKIFKNEQLALITEPGRILVARAGILLARVEYVKTSGKQNFLILNTGMHHLMRPALYGAYHRILPLIQKPGAEVVYNIVGPICESSDIIASGRSLTPCHEGDWVAIADTGAYGYVMSNHYNLHERPQEVII